MNGARIEFAGITKRHIHGNPTQMLSLRDLCTNEHIRPHSDFAHTPTTIRKSALIISCSFFRLPSLPKSTPNKLLFRKEKKQHFARMVSTQKIRKFPQYFAHATEPLKHLAAFLRELRK